MKPGLLNSKITFCIILLLFPLTTWSAGWLDIRSRPGEAAVFVNGQYRGITPLDPETALSLEVVNGLHQVGVFWKNTENGDARTEQNFSIAEGQRIPALFEYVHVPKSASESLPSIIEPVEPTEPASKIEGSKLQPLLRNF